MSTRSPARLVVALGVGANTAAFTLADFVLIRPLPFPAADRLGKVWQSTPGYGQSPTEAGHTQQLPTTGTPPTTERR